MYQSICLPSCPSACFFEVLQKINQTILTSPEAFPLLCTDLRSNQSFFEDLQTRNTSSEDAPVTWLASHDSGEVCGEFVTSNASLIEQRTFTTVTRARYWCKLTRSSPKLPVWRKSQKKKKRTKKKKKERKMQTRKRKRNAFHSARYHLLFYFK